MTRGFVSNVLAVAYRETAVMRHDRAFLAVVTAQPIMMLLLAGFALSTQPRNVPWAVLDQSRTAVSRRLVASIGTSGYFLAPDAVSSYAQGRARLRRGRALAFLVIPADFRREVSRGEPAVELLLDGSDPLSAARVGSVVRQITEAFDPTGRAVEIRRVGAGPDAEIGPIDVRARFWFNPTLRDRDFFLSILAGMLLTNVCLSVTALGLVAERESGTYEQTLALPTTPIEIVLGKLLPYVGMSYVVLAAALLGAGLGFGVWPRGSLIALVLVTLPFVLASLGFGVFVSAVARSSAQAVFIAVFFILPSFVLSGVMLPYQLMPPAVRTLGALLPLRWYQMALRGVVSRGVGLHDVLVPFLALSLFFAGTLALVRWRMKPRLA